MLYEPELSIMDCKVVWKMRTINMGLRLLLMIKSQSLDQCKYLQVHIGIFGSDQMVPVQDGVPAAAVPTTAATEVVEVQSCHKISWTDIKPVLN